MKISKPTVEKKASKFSIDAWRKAGEVIAEAVHYDKEQLRSNQQSSSPPSQSIESLKDEIQRISV